MRWKKERISRKTERGLRSRVFVLFCFVLFSFLHTQMVAEMGMPSYLACTRTLVTVYQSLTAERRIGGSSVT